MHACEASKPGNQPLILCPQPVVPIAPPLPSSRVHQSGHTHVKHPPTNAIDTMYTGVWIFASVAAVVAHPNRVATRVSRGPLEYHVDHPVGVDEEAIGDTKIEYLWSKVCLPLEGLWDLCWCEFVARNRLKRCCDVHETALHLCVGRDCTSSHSSFAFWSRLSSGNRRNFSLCRVWIAVL